MIYLLTSDVIFELGFLDLGAILWLETMGTTGQRKMRMGKGKKRIFVRWFALWSKRLRVWDAISFQVLETQTLCQHVGSFGAGRKETTKGMKKRAAMHKAMDWMRGGN